MIFILLCFLKFFSLPRSPYVVPIHFVSRPPIPRNNHEDQLLRENKTQSYVEEIFS